MIDPHEFESVFHRALNYERYLATDPSRAHAWETVYARTTLTQTQCVALAGFSRRMQVLVVSGVWCGDCAQQGPMLARIAQGSTQIDLRWIDRDREADFTSRLTVCGGARVPLVVFASEDHQVCSVFGDRTLSRYRGLARRQLGAGCELPWAAVPIDESSEVLGEWLNEFERVQWMLRLSPRLRQKHGD